MHPIPVNLSFLDLVSLKEKQAERAALLLFKNADKRYLHMLIKKAGHLPGDPLDDSIRVYSIALST
jgi:hypothetical protein